MGTAKTDTGKHTWLVGSDELVRAEGDGGLFEPVKQTTRTGLCGDWGGRQTPRLGGSPDDGKPCDQRVGNWGDPTPRFVAQLPTDPAGLYDRLRADFKGDKGQMLEAATGVLESAYADEDVRSTVYRALMSMPGLEAGTVVQSTSVRTGVAPKIGVAPR